MPESSTAQESAPELRLPNFFTIKLGVADFERTEEFYGRLFGMKLGPAFDRVPIERPLEWPDEGHGPQIMLYSHAMIAATEGLLDALEGRELDEVNVSIMNGSHAFKAGSSWTLFQVSDIQKCAKELADMGKPHEIMDVGPMTGIHSLVIMSTDPDGNVVEIVQAY
jgi:catechol 2,3-dioxygenase-like lactoylglutathione lyase family enzyme